MLFEDVKKYRFNTKCKVYPHGETNITYCSYKIFPDKALKEKLGVKDRPKKKKQSEYDEMLLSLKSAFDVAEDDEIIVDDEIVSSYSSEVKPKEVRERPDNFKRAIDSVYDIAYCNDWNYFLTITIDPNQIDSYSVPDVMKKLRIWLSNQVQRKGLQYLLIPECHQSGRIHCHALINDVLSLSDSGHMFGNREVYNVDDWGYGWTTAIAIDDNKERLSRYLLK